MSARAQVAPRATSASSGAASAKRDDGQPAAVEPVQDELGQRHGEPPEEAGGDERERARYDGERLDMTDRLSASFA